MAHDCPSCGQKDEKDEWLGARMGSTRWNHDWMCCSDKCGFEWGKVVRDKEKSRNGRKWLAAKWSELASQSDACMGGEPYYGYDAENKLKNRRF